LERGHQLAPQLAVDFVAEIIPLNISANICVEQNRVRDLITVLAEATYRYIHIQPDIRVDHSERDRAWRSVLVADKFLGVEVVDPLIFRRFAPELETFPDRAKRVRDASAQAAVKEGWFAGHIIRVFARIRAEVDDFALLDDNHALPVVYGYDRPVGNDVIAAFFVG